MTASQASALARRSRPPCWPLLTAGTVVVALVGGYGWAGSRRRHHATTVMLVQHERDNRALRRVNEAAFRSLATTSHELRSPLVAILAETELLTRFLPSGDDDELCRRLISAARSNTEHLLALVDDLMDLSRIEAGRLDLHLEELDLREVAEHVAGTLQPGLAGRDVTLRVIGTAPTALVADRRRLRQVVTNLIDNAANVTPAGGTVDIEVIVHESGVALHVRDQGRGIPPGELERMFSPFERGSPNVRGLGIGLTIARHLVEAHGGTLQAVSTLDVGSCFTAEFSPAGRCIDRETSAAATRPSPGGGTTPSSAYRRTPRKANLGREPRRIGWASQPGDGWSS